MNHKYYLDLDYISTPLEFGKILLYQIGRLYCKPSHIIPSHFHGDLFELTIATGGKGTVSTNGIDTEVSAGDIYFSMPCDMHEIRADKDDPLKYDFFAFKLNDDELKQNFENILKEYYSPESRVFRSSHIPEIVSDAISEMSKERLYSNDMLSAMFLQTVIYILRDFRKKRPEKRDSLPTTNEAVCYQIMNYIETHLSSMKSLEELCEVTGYSYGYLSALFKKTTSTTISDFYRDKKLEAARRLISEGRLKITEIAEMLGYSSLYSFSKAFCKRYGVSPKIYQKENSSQMGE